MYDRYNNNVDKVVDEIKNIMLDMDLDGQWSIDIMQNKDDFYIIDMALASQSALNDVIDKSKFRPALEKWLPKIDWL